MQNVNNIGVTQFNGMQPRSQINMGGVEWVLRRDATDSSMIFPHQKVNWLNAGCEPMADGRAHYCWIMGVIAPTPGTIERPINVMYVGFHPQKIVIAPNAVGIPDLDRMHVYTSDGSDFAGKFVSMFLGQEPAPVEQRETISPWPPLLDKGILEPKPEQRVQQPAPQPQQQKNQPNKPVAEVTSNDE